MWLYAFFDPPSPWLKTITGQRRVFVGAGKSLALRKAGIVTYDKILKNGKCLGHKSVLPGLHIAIWDLLNDS